MAYESYFSGGNGPTATKGSGGYQSYFNIPSVKTAQPMPVAPKPVTQPKAAPSLISKVGGAAKTVATGVKNFGESGAKSVYDIGRGAAASGSYPGGKLNPTALANAHKAKATDFPAFASTIYKPAVQAVESVAHPLSQHSVTPTSATEQLLLGKSPIQNINKGVNSTYEAQKAKGSSTLKSTLLGGLYGAGQVAQDAGTIAGVKAGGLVDDTAETANKARTAVKTVTGKNDVVNDALKTAKQNTLLNKARTSNITDDIGKTATKPIPEPDIPKTDTVIPHTETQALKPAEKVMATKEPALFAHTYLKNNQAQAEADYAARTRSEFGNTKNNIVSGDEAKFIIPGFKGSNSVPYHEAASAFAKQHYAQLLKDPATKDQPVMIMAGGSGAGKTSSLRQVMGKEDKLDNYAAVVDTNLTDMKGAESRIQAARASGRPVAINYVYRDPEDAYKNGVIPRAARTGRVVTPAIHASTHAGSFDTIFQLAEKYKNDPDVSINAIDNSRGEGKSTVVPLDSLKNKGYTKDQIELKTHQLLDESLKSNTITKDQYHDLKGTSGTNQIPDDVQTASSSVSSDVVRKPESTPKEATSDRSSSSEVAPKPAEVKSEEGISKVAQSVQEKAVAKGLKDDFGEPAHYDKLTIKDQAAKAVKLTNDREALDKVISGEKPLPDGLRATALIKAIEEHPVLGKDPDMIRRLSSSPLASESSRSAQELRLAAERAPTSPVEAARQVAKARADAFEVKNKTTVGKAITATTKDIKAAKVKVTPKTWDDFIESIKC